MVGRYLVTTADERTWPANRPIVFLGEWCRLFRRKHVWEKLDATVVPYHWDDRKKLYRDYQYIQCLYETVLEKLARILNQIHGVDHSLRYWRILVGPWLGYFMQMLFDRWSMIEYATNHHQLAGVTILNSSGLEMIPNDMSQFNRLYITDQWNESIYGYILKKWTNLPVDLLTSDGIQPQPILPLPSNSWKSLLLPAFTVWSRLTCRSHDAFFISEYLPKHLSFTLQFRIGQLPKHWQTVRPVTVKPDLSQRQWRIDLHGQGFPDILGTMMPLHIPTVYLEGYAAIQRQTDGMPWPKQPKLIFTSNSYNADDVFKAWAAGKVESGSPLVIGQHGGHYGIGRWSFSEDHECQISNSYLSWGWTDNNCHRIKPVGQLKAKRPLGVQHASQSSALLVTCTMSRYSYWMYSVSVASQWLHYFQDQVRFVDNLPKRIRDALIVRLYSHDYGWDQMARWQDEFPNLQLDSGTADINKLIRKSRIYISTYNATTFLESFTMNVPTVIFWNPNHWELRESAVPYFKKLKEVGIFHESPESAAKQVAKVWDDVDAWWDNQDVVSVRKEFCMRYADLADDLLKRIEKALRDAFCSHHQ